MPGEDFDALLRASRWAAALPYLDPNGDGPLKQLPISSPLHGALQLEDFQLVPLLKALTNASGQFAHRRRCRPRQDRGSWAHLKREMRTLAATVALIFLPACLHGHTTVQLQFSK
jgi:hypothetical protein